MAFRCAFRGGRGGIHIYKHMTDFGCLCVSWGGGGGGLHTYKQECLSALCRAIFKVQKVIVVNA